MLDVIKVMEPRLAALILTALGMLAAGAAAAQTSPSLGSEAPDRTPPSGWTDRSAEALEELVGPIALYPDDLVAIVLPASTFPLQIVQAARYLEQRERDPNLEPDEAWDESVVALLNYPEALALLNEDLDWTWALGEAVVYQQGDVLEAIQTFRDRAYAAGNLESDDRQMVANDGETITIEPAEPEVVYVPYYDPARVVVRHSYPVYHYYPYAYPVYYYPYRAGYSFGSRFFWGVTTAFAISWHDHFLHVHHHRHFGHPYYGRSYHLPYYARHRTYISVNRVHGHDRWRPGHRHGARPGRDGADYRVRDRVRDRRVRITTAGGRLEGHAQPRRGLRQSQGVPPSSFNRVVPAQPARTATIRADSRLAQPRGSREALRERVSGSSRAPRVALQGSRSLTPQAQRARQRDVRQQRQNGIRGGTPSRARVIRQTARPETRVTRPSTFGRVSGARSGVRQAQPSTVQRSQSAWRGAKTPNARGGGHARGGGRLGNRGRVSSSPRERRRAR